MNPEEENNEILDEEIPQEEEKAESVAKKKVVYVEIDDEVTGVYDKIKNIGSKHVYIVVPKRAILFQSIVNLKILKRKSEDDGKKIYLISNDKNGVHLAEKLGLPVYNKVNSEGKPALFSTDVQDDRLRITPLRASVNSVEEKTPTRMAERKLSISEILRKKRGRKDMDVTKIEVAKKPKKPKNKMVIVAANRHALIALISVSVLILLFIIYIALPGATIYITPAASKLEKSVNIVLADFTRNKAEIETSSSHIIASYPISTKVEKQIEYTATGKKFSDKGKNASGKITIYNTTNGDWPLIASTRFQTEDGIVFRIPAEIIVPPATTAGPGQIEAFVVADQTDAFGGIVGERGNIGPSKFSLPGLKGSSQSKVYAESKEAFSGGITDYVTFVTPEDIEAAKAKIRDELVKGAVAQLEVAVEEQNKLVEESGKFVLLEGENAVKVGEAAVSLDESLANKEIASFVVSGSVDVKGVYYDQEEMVKILVDELTLKKSPNKELLDVNQDSATYRIFEWDDASGKIKLTANIKGIEQFSIDPKKESGQKLLEKIRSHIAGQNIEEAKLFVQNLPEVNKVEIDSWPAWSPTVPNIEDNIDFEIRDAVKVD